MIPVDHDLHVHTYLSSCCSDKEGQTPANILALAEEMGLATLGFSDHLWMNPDLEPSSWYRPQDEGQIARLRDDLSRTSTSVRVLVGCEADTIAPGKFSITRGFAESLDYVGLACSHFHMTTFVQQPIDNSPRAIGKHLVKFFVSAVESGLATTIVHPLQPCGYVNQYDEAIAALSDGELSDALAAAARLGVALEITTSFLPPAPKDDYSAPVWSIDTPLRVLSLAKTAGCKFTFGSDGHTRDAMRRLKELEVFSKLLDLAEDDLAPITKRTIS